MFNSLVHQNIVPIHDNDNILKKNLISKIKILITTTSNKMPDNLLSIHHPEMSSYRCIDRLVDLKSGFCGSNREFRVEFP